MSFKSIFNIQQLTLSNEFPAPSVANPIDPILKYVARILKQFQGFKNNVIIKKKKQMYFKNCDDSNEL